DPGFRRLVRAKSLVPLVRTEQLERRGPHRPAQETRVASARRSRRTPRLLLSHCADCVTASVPIRRLVMKTMRAALILLSLGPLTATAARPSRAETYPPWCVVYSGRTGGARNCGFPSFEQCLMTAGPGTGGSCVQNPWYLWYGSNSSSTTGRGGWARR